MIFIKFAELARERWIEIDIKFIQYGDFSRLN